MSPPFVVSAGGSSDSVAAFQRLLTGRKSASGFSHHRSKRAWTKEDLMEECCNRDCTFEERAEFAEDHGWDWVGKSSCEISIVEA